MAVNGPCNLYTARVWAFFKSIVIFVIYKCDSMSMRERESEREGERERERERESLLFT